MPRAMSPKLVACLDRENPYVETFVELSAPDVSRVLRLADEQLLQAPDPQVSLTPAASLIAAPAGGVQLASTAATLVDFASTSGPGAWDISQEDASRRIKGLMLQLDPAFDQAVIRRFHARLLQDFLTVSFPRFTIELQIYRAAAIAGYNVDGFGNRTPFTQWDFAPLIPGGKQVTSAEITWSSAGSGLQQGTAIFDLTGLGIVLDASREGLPSNSLGNGMATYYFSIRLVSGIASNLHWRTDATTARTVAGVGSFQQVFWGRDNPNLQWTPQFFAQAPSSKIEIENFAPAGGSAQAVYKIDLDQAPSAGTLGRAVFGRATPLGTTIVAEISSAGAGGPWTAVTDGKSLGALGIPVQQIYHMRATLVPSASHRASPVLASLGVEYRTPNDVSLESVTSPLNRDVDMPYCTAAIADGSIKVLRTGRRDFGDVATMLGATQPAPQLEADIFLRSRHPNVSPANGDRDAWFRIDRATVADRVPSDTSETLPLLSYASLLTRKIPLPQESINGVLTVGSATTTAVTVTGALPGTTVSGNEYDAKHYYVRVQRSVQIGVETGKIFEIAGNSGTNQLDFAAGDLPSAFVAGDILEVHSGILVTPPLTFSNMDLADIWREILQNHLQVPTERIGAGHLPRQGLPPRVTDIAPGDAATQAKRKVSIQFTEEQSGNALLDQISFLLGGATIEIGGNICFVQIYPLRDASGKVTVPLPPASLRFDPRDYFSPSFPVGLQERMSAVRCKYGVDLTVPENLRLAAAQTEWADSDAINWLTLSPSDNRGREDIPDEIARWCYSVADGGLFLASEATHQVVNYFATGKRVWQWSSRDARPTAQPGDVATIATDQYTDYDPSGLVSISGWLAITVVVLGVSGDGRRFRGCVPGISGGTVRAVGGVAGEITGGSGAAVAAPAITVTHKLTNLIFAPKPTLLVSFTPPSDPNFAGVALKIKTNGDASTIAYVDASVASPIWIPAAWDTVYEITPIGVSQGGVRTVGVPVTYTTPNGNTWRRDIPLMKSDGSGAFDGYMAKGDGSDPTGQTMPNTQQIIDGTQGRQFQRGYQWGWAADGAVITFSPPYSIIPATRVSPGPGAIGGQPDSTKWTAGYSAAVSWRPDFRFTALSALGGTINGKFRQKATSTLRQTDFPNTTLNAVGSETLIAANAPSQTGSYTIRYNWSVTTQSSSPGSSRTATLTVTVRKRAGGPTGTPTVLSTKTYRVTDPDGTGPYTNLGIEVLTVSVVLTASDYIEVEYTSLTHIGSFTGSDSASVRGAVHTDAAPSNVYGLEFTTTGGADSTTTATPDTGDLMFWESWLP